MTINSFLLPLSVIGLMVVLNALYVAAEFATVGSRKSRAGTRLKRQSCGTGLLAILQDAKAAR